MKIHEVKLRLNSSINKLIDTYFGLPTVTEKMVNATLKIIAKQKLLLTHSKPQRKLRQTVMPTYSV